MHYDPAPYKTFFENDVTYINGFWRNATRYADRPALHDPAAGESITYGELAVKVRRVASGLLAAGVGAGDVVAYQLLNGEEFATLYLATQAIGAVGSPVNFRLAAGETAYVLGMSAPKVFVYDTSLNDMVAETFRLASFHPDLVVGVGDTAPAELPVGETIRWADLAVDPVELPDHGRTVWDETTRLYTSGTTGMPKAVPMNSMIEIFSAHDVIMHFPLAPDDITLNMTPWFHRGGLYSGGPNPTFYVGGQVLTMRVFDAATTLDLVEREGVTFLVGAPTNLAMLATEQEARPRDLSSLRGIVTMGSPLEREAALRYQEVLNPRIFNGYGTTEGFWNTFLRPADVAEKAGSAGSACIDDDVRVVRLFEDRLAEPHEVVDRDGEDVGEVIIRSPKCSNTYFNASEKENAKFNNGWLHIGDLATWDAEEFVTIVGRKDDMLVSGGENVHPVQVEEALNEHAGVADSLVVGVPDAKWGRRVVAFIVPTTAGDPPAVEDLDRHCRNHPMLSDFKRPRAYRMVDRLPLTATGKKVHYKASQQASDEYTAGLFTDAPSSSTRS